MKISNIDKEKYKMYSLKGKGAPGSVEDLSPVFKEIKCLKKSLMLKGTKRIGHVSERSQPDELPI